MRQCIPLPFARWRTDPSLARWRISQAFAPPRIQIGKVARRLTGGLPLCMLAGLLRVLAKKGDRMRHLAKDPSFVSTCIALDDVDSGLHWGNVCQGIALLMPAGDAPQSVGKSTVWWLVRGRAIARQMRALALALLLAIACNPNGSL